MATTIKQKVDGSSDQVPQAPFRQDQLRNLVDGKGGKIIPAKTKDGLKEVFRLKWSEWTRLLTKDQMKTTEQYAQSSDEVAIMEDSPPQNDGQQHPTLGRCNPEPERQGKDFLHFSRISLNSGRDLADIYK